MARGSQAIVMPNEAEAIIALESSRKLAPHIHRDKNMRLRVLEDDGSADEITLPATAVRFLLDLLSQMSQGNAFTLIPVHAELTTQQAADICNVSRPFIVAALESGELTFKRVGTHRRIKFKDLMDYKNRMDQKRTKALDDLSKLDQELGLGE